MEHKDLVREEFTRQAPGYADAPVIKDPLHLQKLLDQVKPDAAARVLEIATGPGHVALAFARVCREVIGVDLTEAPLKIAERMRAERGLANARFMQGDVEARLPFADGEFDVVICRFAVHHFEHPEKVIAEMSRLCRVGGAVAIEDLISSEHPERADYYNRYERLRDSSHTRALPLSELVRTIASVGLELVRFGSDGLMNPVERWLDAGFTPADKRAEALAMIERDLAEDLTGANPRRVDGELFFTHRTAIVVARKLKPRG
ncbi:MAG: class I SAM-dependent methyltransferase [Candidatus Binatus sp.]|uniref:class I SAM-dependent methyltransferase n=1 Tax=Candidatus Binatus sp. TaxID=2811406 RepID=UPI0027256BFC|nr:class I SAM-dependent methyltransferase [Candidatus Binatus sp.]MDO8434650.1 class I SAM-dependent methyltransferase [Candidatus Binatus sp.]